jgi:hypothetical protein
MLRNFILKEKSLTIRIVIMPQKKKEEFEGLLPVLLNIASSIIIYP